MAETPRDKRDDKGSTLEQFQQWQKESAEDSAIREFRNARKKALAKLIRESNDAERQLSLLTEQYKKMTEDDIYYDQVGEQVQQLRAKVTGYNKQKDDMIAKLKAAGQEYIVSEAEAAVVDSEMINHLKQKQQIVNDINEEISRTTDPKKLKELKAKLKTAQAEAEDPELINKANYKKTSNKDAIQSVGSTNSMPSLVKNIVGGLTGEEKSHTGEALRDTIGKVPGILGIIGNVLGKILDVAIAIRGNVNQWVDEAAAVLANNVGKINAALEGTGQTYQSATENMVESLGLSRFVKQTDYISQIATLTSRGITYNVEQRALLETIKDKTVASFSSMDANLLRLVRLKQQDLTASQFGLEAALRNTLNRVFKDSTYLQDMYDSISGAITDAVIISGAKDVTEYSSVIQTWMGAMYESGVDSSTVSKLANALNYLGSGNVSALASDQDIQRLVLLSMDTIGMDYADILQQGLSTSDINNLLNAIVEYLNKIESNTKDNNVLTSSYTNLFGMSMADLQAFKNLKSKTGQLQAVNMGTALSVVNNELAALQSTERTLVNEQIENVFDNAKFTFGSSIAKDASSYMTWKVSNLMLDVVNQVMNAPIGKSPLKTAIKAVGIVTEASIFSQELKGILSIARALPSLFKEENGGLQTLINGAPSYGDSTSISATISSTGSNFKSVNTMSRIQSNQQYQQEYASYSGEAWEKEEEESDPVLEKLESLCSTLTENEAGKKAFAVFLAGMTNEALNSFASIFADEDAMANTFSGENNVLKDNLYKYGEDTSSNSTEASTKTK